MNRPKKCKRLQLRLTEETLSRLRALARSQRESMAGFLEQLISREWDEQVNFYDLNLYEFDDLSDVCPEIYLDDPDAITPEINHF